MSTGPLFPSSAYPASANDAFYNVHVGAGSGSKYDEGMGIVASLGTDATWALRFQLPSLLPSGMDGCLVQAIVVFILKVGIR